MRIIAGEARGLRLKALKGRQTRPTSGLVRGAIFGILESMGAKFDRVLDLYAGTGALGIEALSRGASWVDFVEQDRRSCGVIRENLKALGFSERSHVYCCPVSRALGFRLLPYDVIIADPPYGRAAPAELLGDLAGCSAVSRDTVIVLEVSRRSEKPESTSGMALIKERRHGDTCIWVYGKEV